MRIRFALVRMLAPAPDGAVERGNQKMVHWLLEAGADKDGRCSLGNGGRRETLLGAAVRKGNLEMARLLLDIRADINASPSETSGGTLLTLAISNDDVKMVSLLVESRVDVSQEYQLPGALHEPGLNRVVTPLQHALARGREEIVQIIQGQQASSLTELQNPPA